MHGKSIPGWILFGLAAEVVAQAPPLGPEFRVNTYTTGNQSRPSVAMDSAGNFVAVWQSSSQDGSGAGIFAQRFASAGEPLVSEFQVNTYTTGSQERPAVAMNPSGRFIVVWQSSSQDGSGLGVYAQRYDEAGKTLGAEFPVHEATTGDQSNPDVAVDENGAFVVVWQTKSAEYWNIHARRFDVAGSPMEGEFVVNMIADYGNAMLPKVATNGQGEFVVAWHHLFYFHTPAVVRRFESSGFPACNPLNVGKSSSTAAPAVEMAPSGKYVVAFTELGNVMAQRFELCSAIDDAFPLNDLADDEDTSPSIAGDALGGFIVTWDSPSDGSNTGIFARRVDAEGELLGPKFLVNAFTTDAQTQPVIAMNGIGRAILAWESFGQDGSGLGIYARRPAAAVAAGLSVDLHTSGGAGSNVNGLLEPGETARVEPAWQNVLSSEIALTGTASDLIGPPGPIYEIADSSADYGSIPAGGSAGCADATDDCFEVSIMGSRPAGHWDIVLEETLSTSDNRAWTLHVAESFLDVPVTDMFYADVENLFHNGIAEGCGEAIYCPSGSVRRDQMAVFLLKARHGGSYVPPPCAGIFSDVPCPSLFADWIEQLQADAITGGCGGSSYCPSSPVSRAQMAAFLLKAEHGASYLPPPCNEVFPDVPCPSLFADWIERLYHEGITAGCGGGNYCPDSSSTRGQMAVFLVKTFGMKLYGP